SRLRARPSQNTGEDQARFHKVGVWRLSGRPGTPRPCTLPSAKPLPRSWQLAHARLPSIERRLSWKSASPSARFCSENGLSAGNGTVGGGRKGGGWGGGERLLGGRQAPRAGAPRARFAGGGMGLAPPLSRQSLRPPETPRWQGAS